MAKALDCGIVSVDYRLAARDRGEVPVLFQLLIYPMLDDRTGSSRPVPEHIGQLLWNAEHNRFGWLSFHGFDAIGADTALGSQLSEAKISALRRAFENAAAE